MYSLNDISNVEDKNDFLEWLWKQKEIGNLLFPFEKPDISEIKRDFEQLKNQSFLKIIKKGNWNHRYKYEFSKNDYYFDLDYTGLKSSDYFNFHNRMKVDSINCPSPIRVWNNKKFFKNTFSALFSLKYKDCSNKNIRSCISMCRYVASQFRPSVAKSMFELFKSKNILDFSSGWNDRLNGFLATKHTEFYYGIDPNTELFLGYKENIEMFNKSKLTFMVNCCSEDCNEITTKFDMIFTSPPYFNVERYSNDESQSWKKYRNFNDWLEKFLYKTLDKFWNNLEDDGILAINIADVYSGHKIRNICDNMNKFISEKLPNSKYLGCIGYRMQKRFNSKSNIDGVFAEPIWIWTKETNKNNLQYYLNKLNL